MRTSGTRILLCGALWLLLPGIAHGDVCEPGQTHLCLNENRFRVDVEWEDFAGVTGHGRPAAVTADDSGVFWFFDRDNWEMLVKVIDGCPLNERYWVFSAATTNVKYALTVTDTLSGQSRRYENPAGRAAPAVTDTDAFATCGTTGQSETAATTSEQAGTTQPLLRTFRRLVREAGEYNTNSGCDENENAVCLAQERFKVEVDWIDLGGSKGKGRNVSQAAVDSALFWFFQPDNWEFLVKVLDACEVNGHFWVFGAATTNVGYELTVTDTYSGEVMRYRNEVGTSASAITDTSAFSTCDVESSPELVLVDTPKNLTLTPEKATAVLKARLIGSNGAILSNDIEWSTNIPHHLRIEPIADGEALIRLTGEGAASGSVSATAHGLRVDVGVDVVELATAAVQIESAWVLSKLGERLEIESNDVTRGVAVGQVIISDLEAGVLMRVTHVEDLGSLLVINGEPATLADAFSDYAFTIRPIEAEASPLRQQASAIRAFKCSDPRLSLDMDIGVELRKGRVVGEAKLKERHFSFGLGGELAFVFETGALQIVDGLSVELNCSINLAEIPLIGGTIGGLVQVSGKTRIRFEVALSLASGGATAVSGGGLEVAVPFLIGVQYSPQSGPVLVNEVDRIVRVEPLSLTAPTSIEVALELLYPVQLFGEASVGVGKFRKSLVNKTVGYLDPGYYFRLDVSAPVNPGSSQYRGPKWDNGFFVAVGLGGQDESSFFKTLLEKLGFDENIEVQFELARIEFPLFSSPEVGLTSSPMVVRAGDLLELRVQASSGEGGEGIFFRRSAGSGPLIEMARAPLSHGVAAFAWTPTEEFLGEHEIFGRAKFGSLGSVLPYAANAPVRVRVVPGDSPPTPPGDSVPSVPGSPSPGSTSSPGPTMASSTVLMNWSGSIGATYYQVGVRDIAADELVVNTTASDISYMANLSAGRQYRWNVNACNGNGCSSFTTPLYFQTPGSSPPEPPEEPAPATPTGTSPGSTSSPGPTVASTTVTLSWNGSSGATYYELGVRDMGTNQFVVDTNVSGTSHTASLSAGRQYRWNVNACNSNGCSSFTTPLYLQTPGGVAPATPTGTSPGSTSSPGPTVASTTVTLSWNGSSGATYYELGVRDMGTNQFVVDTNVSGTSHTASLSAGRQYRWNVSACNSNGCSSFTTPLYFQTPGGAAPATPTGTSPGSTSSPGPTVASATVTLSWNGSSGATYYELGVRDMGTNQFVVDTNVSGTSHTASLSAGRQYRWNVNACNSNGCSSFTTPLYLQTPGGVAPATPTGTSPGSTSSPGPTVASTTVTLSWNGSSGATYYGLGVRDMGTNLLVVDTNVFGTSHTASLSAGRQYRWNVNACNSNGCSSFTTPLYLQTPGGVAPATPTGTSPGSTSSPGPTVASTTVTLSWNGSSGATHYGLGVRDMGTNLLVVDTNVFGTSHTASLSAGRQYRWNVNACNSNGCSSFTTPLYLQTPGGVAPATPTGTSPGSTSSPGPTVASTTVTLSWNGSSGATHYGLGVRDMGTNQLVVDTNVSGTSYTASLSAGRQYRWNVSACNSNGCSSFTTPLYFQTPGGSPPSTPTGTSPGSTSSPGPTVGSSTVNIDWSSSSGASYYELGIRDMGTNQLVVDTQVSSSSYTASLSAGRQYRWNVSACNSNGCSSFTTPLYFQTPGGSPPSTPTGTSPGSTSSPGPTLGSSTVNIDWSSSSGASYYEIGIRDMGSNQLVVDTQVSSSSYTASLSAGRQYRWNVSACNSNGCSSFTTPLYFQTPGGSPPSTPTGTSPGSTSSPGPTVGSSTVNIDWSSSSGASYYELGIRDMGTNQLVVDTQVSSSSYTASLNAGRQYRWNVSACNSNGCSSFTTPLYFQTPGGSPPSTPTSTTPGSTSSPGPLLGSRTVSLDWSSPSGASYYELGVRDMSSNQLVVDTQVSSSSSTVTLSAGRTYRWNVAACNSSGCSSFTTPLYFRTP